MLISYIAVVTSMLFVSFGFVILMDMVNHIPSKTLKLWSKIFIVCFTFMSHAFIISVYKS